MREGRRREHQSIAAIKRVEGDVRANGLTLLRGAR